ncbi:DUF1905 domain-containing protein [Arthrobacter sp. H41]|uniref:DUF1905 domain-containing protein n=1 Tax=Arthrobacter sp. H41 TaxID=1312978 RepID=UPI00403830BA
MRSDATLELGDRTATGIEVPESVLEKLGGGRRPAVTGTVNGYGYRTIVGSMNGRAMLPVSAEHRQAGGPTAGADARARRVQKAVRELAALAQRSWACSRDTGLSGGPGGGTRVLRWACAVEAAGCQEPGVTGAARSGSARAPGRTRYRRIVPRGCPC